MRVLLDTNVLVAAVTLVDSDALRELKRGVMPDEPSELSE